ncbi:hypothetical protein Tco_0050830, partial [Tanacetum coccineum]
ISTIVEADSYPIRHLGSSQYAVWDPPNMPYGILPIRRMGSSQYAVSAGQDRTLIKEKDLRSFTLTCFINNVCFDNALADLGASISVMLLSTYFNLGLGELAHTK